MFPRLDIKQWTKAYLDMTWLIETYTSALTKDPNNEGLKKGYSAVESVINTSKDLLAELGYMMGKYEIARGNVERLAKHINHMNDKLRQSEEEKESLRFTISELQKEINRLAELAEEPDAKQIAEKQFKENERT